MADFGIGESLLAEIATGAVVGGGISALTGGDFLTGALTGGIGGGLGYGIKGLDFGKIFNPSQAAPAIGADVGNKTLTSAGQAAYTPQTIATSPFGTTEAVSATSPAFGGFGTSTYGTSGIANLANTGVSPAVIEAARNNSIAQAQAAANAGQTLGAGQTSTANVSNAAQPPKVAGSTEMTPEQVITSGKAKPYGFSNAANGPLQNGDYVYNGKIYKGADIIKAAQPQSFFDKYKMPIIMGGLGLGYKMLTAPPNTAYAPPERKSNLSGYNLAPNYQALPNPTPVYPTFAEGGIAQLAKGGNMEISHPNVDFMGGDMYPMSQQSRSFYATPSQMPTSAQQVMASYEPKTNPLTGQPTVNMSSGGPISFAKGGDTDVGGPVYYDPEVGQFYTLNNPSGAIFGSFGSPWGMGYNASLSAMGLENKGRNYLGSTLGSSANNFTRQEVTPTVYQPTYGSAPTTDATMPAPTAPTPTYSLTDSASLLAATSPNIAEATGIRPMARGGIADLGAYSDGGRMLQGPGDGMSDSIPGVIANKRPARLADGEFVVPADVVSHLGNGSTDAGAKQLYAMMDKVRQARTGTKKQGKQINPRKLMPA